jgi:hypothetical protein
MGGQPSTVAQPSERPHQRRGRRHRSGFSRRLLREARYRRTKRLATTALLAGIVVAVTLYLAWRFSIYQPPPGYL